MAHELVTNAARHACFGGRDGQIRVELSRAGPSAKCIVSDNGSSVAGLKPGRGLKIVNDLVKSLAGRLQHRLGAEGTSAALVFPLTERELQASQAVAARRERTARRPGGRPPLRGSNQRRPTPTGVSSQQVWI
jgi:signal transduction histidine kinase